ncbi:MAG: hypothetical protein KJO79_04440, partial [Verrucomicrobiae bacterium]|nr:hypothetical protein [Verrucomicrobiae bacterium]NNJ86406.1 hypothetical protein [Akkermansiaceae bacterium]
MAMIFRFQSCLYLSLLSLLSAAAKEAVLLDGFQMEKIYQVPKKQGSWVSLTKDDQGRLITSDQYGSLYRVTVAPDAQVVVEELPVKMGGAHGLLWFDGKLYVSVSERTKARAGVYVITDSNGDGELDHIELIKSLAGGGEHGPHGLVPSPDGKWIYIVCGNHTNVPKGVAVYHATNQWDEDQLIPSQPDARGHARTRKAPGGWIARFKPDGNQWEMFSHGYRNVFDIAFNNQGELFAYDADMEWDFGTPWYRPTR